MHDRFAAFHLQNHTRPGNRIEVYVIFHNKAGASRNERYYPHLPISEEQA